MFKSLNEFISRLDREGELVRIAARVDPVLEIAEIADRISKSPGGGKALLFENTGTGFPLLINAFGSERRVASALGANDLDEITRRIDALLGSLTAPKANLYEKLRMLPLLGEMSRWLPKTSASRGECQQVVLRGEEARLSLLPVLQCWPHDGGRFVTLPIVCTLDPDTGARNAGMYRMQILSDRTTGMHWHMHKTGERHYRAYRQRGEKMPVSVCLGGDPAYTYAATAPMPDNLDEWLLAGFLRRRPVRLVKCITNDIYVPADCDLVIEGWVDPAEEKVTEGPFGDHTGFYSLEDRYPVFHVEAITHRNGAVYPATIVGVPPQEDFYMARATEKIFLAPIRMALQPEVRDLWMPAEGVAHNIAVVNIEPSYPGQPFKVAGALWGAGQMMFNKIMLVASTGEDVRRPEVLAAILRGIRIPEAVTFSKGVLDVLDHTAQTMGTGGKVAVDATLPPREHEVSLPDKFTFCGGVESADRSPAAQWSALILHARPGVAIDIPAFLAANAVGGVNFILVADAAAAGLSPGEIVWLAAGNADPVRDMSIHGGSLIVDGRSKLPGTGRGYPARWPNVVTSSAETIALVDRRWTEYGLGAFIPSPSLRYAPLLFPGGAQARAGE